MKESIIKSTEGNKHNQVKIERELRNLGTESCVAASDKGEN